MSQPDLSTRAGQVAYYGPIRARLMYGPVRRPNQADQGHRIASRKVLEVSEWLACPVNMLVPSSWKFILAFVSAKHGVSEAKILGPARFRELVAARHEAIYLMRTHTDMSLLEITKAIGRDASTILHAVRKFQSKLSAPIAGVDNA